MEYTEKLSLVQALRDTINPIYPDSKSYYPLLDQIGDAHYVLLGEATHGTKEFYESRALITNLLIKEKGFNVIAIEADLPETYNVNAFLRDTNSKEPALSTLNSFQRFPVWMWKNIEMLSFIDNLKSINNKKLPEQRIGFYGLDLYSMYTSVEQVISYLQKVDPQAAEKAQKRYSCFFKYGKNDDAYGQAMSYVSESCQKEVIEQLTDLQLKKMDYVENSSFLSNEDLFFAEQNAKLIKNAEQYYRQMFDKRVQTWNLRDLHMADTVESITQHITKVAGYAKIVIWTHNSHAGNALGTEFAKDGELNLGQLILFRHWGDAFLIGYTTYTGTVLAASDWGEDPKIIKVTPALDDSYESLFHETDLKAFIFDLTNINSKLDFFKQNHLERAIGVVYTPESEKVSHYFNARLADQFHAVIHFDNSSSIHAID